MKKKLQKISFTGKTIFIGLDVHLKTWYASILHAGSAIKKSFPADPKVLHRYLQNNYPDASFEIAYEAGYCGFWIHEELTKLGYKVSVINPADVPSSDKDLRTKTDRSDSKKIALSLKANMLNEIYVPPKEVLGDRALVRHRKSLRKDETRYKNRIKGKLALLGIAMPEQFAKPNTHWSKRFIKWLSAITESMTESDKLVMESLIRQLLVYRSEILEVTSQIRSLSRSERYAKYYNLLVSIPGISLISGMTLLTEIHDIKRFSSPDKLLSYFGIVPTEHSSGEKQRIGNMTYRKNKALRKIIIESAWIARRYDPSLTEYYSRSLQRMDSSRAIIKVAKKLILRIYKIWLSEQKYVKGLA